MNRVIKRFLYGIVFLGIIVLIFWGSISSLISPAPSCSDNVQNQGESGVDCGGPCISCDLVNVRPLKTVGEYREFELTRGTGILFEVSNPNPNHDGRFNYKLTLLDENGSVVDEIFDSSYAFASYGDYVYKTVFSNFDEIEIEIIDTEWTQNESGERPEITSSTIVFKGNNIVRIDGIISNPLNKGFNQIMVIGILKDELGFNELSSFQTVANSVRPLEEKSFSREISVSQDIINEINLEETTLYLSAKN